MQLVNYFYFFAYITDFKNNFTRKTQKYRIG